MLNPFLDLPINFIFFLRYLSDGPPGPPPPPEHVE